MKIGVFMMATNVQPSSRNVDAFKDTVIRYCNERKRKHDYHFYIYWSDENVEGYEVRKDDSFDNVTNVIIQEKESVYRTYEKTYKTFSYMRDEVYDLYVRINISMYLNIDLLDEIADKFEKDIVYCNAINSHVNGTSEYLNDIYPRGDLLIFGRKIYEGIIDNGEGFMYSDVDLFKRDGVDHVDDCLIGIVLIKIFGKYYFKHIEMLKYNFLPGPDVVDGDVDMDCIGSRIKTVPQGECSGYSWNDNEYRLKDVVKFKSLYNIYKRYIDEENYIGYDLIDVVVDEPHSRPTLFVQMGNYPVKGLFWKYLEQKR